MKRKLLNAAVALRVGIGRPPAHRSLELTGRPLARTDRTDPNELRTHFIRSTIARRSDFGSDEVALRPATKSTIHLPGK